MHPSANIELVEGDSGNFIVHLDGRQIWHKREMGDEFPSNEAILAELS